MNKTITIYELLGMIKDEKAPKKIKIGNHLCRLNDNCFGAIECMYVDENDECWFDVAIIRLDTTLEILDEEDEFIEIKCVSTWVACDSDFTMKSIDGHCLNIVDLLDKAYKEYSNAINQLIHNQKILIERLENANKE